MHARVHVNIKTHTLIFCGFTVQVRVYSMNEELRKSRRPVTLAFMVSIFFKRFVPSLHVNFINSNLSLGPQSYQGGND